MRADAQRNRARILDAARELVAAEPAPTRRWRTSRVAPAWPWERSTGTSRRRRPGRGRGDDSTAGSPRSPKLPWPPWSRGRRGGRHAVRRAVRKVLDRLTTDRVFKAAAGRLDNTILAFRRRGRPRPAQWPRSRRCSTAPAPPGGAGRPDTRRPRDAGRRRSRPRNARPAARALRRDRDRRADRWHRPVGSMIVATLILLRHGRSSANAAGVLAGGSPGVELDETGRGQAEKVVGRWMVCRRRDRLLADGRCTQTVAPLRRRPGAHTGQRAGAGRGD